MTWRPHHVAGDFFSRLDVGMKKEFRKEALANYRHMSFVCEHYMLYNRFEAFKGAKSLRTFLAVSFVGNERRGSFYLSNTALTDLLHELPLLRVLSLSHLSISEVPEFIGSLKHLRYLNLSYTEITHLPENVCNLYNLQTLIVFGCKELKKLPNNFSRLKNLSHFDIRDTPLLKEMPFGIGELKSLRTLPKIIIGGGSGFSITKLKDLKDFRGKMSLNRLDKVRSPIHTQEMNFSQRRLSELEVEWSDVFDDSRIKTLEKEVLNVLKPHNDTLKQLRVVSYGGIEFPNWVGDPSFHQLAHLSIEGCKTCTSLPPLGQLPSLKKLFIRGMDELKVVGSEFLGTCIPFPSLEFLSFQDMHGWEVWSTNNSGAFNTVFPCLQELLLDHCHKLVDLSLEALPSLRILIISECGPQVLGSLVRVASSVTKLDIKDITGLNDQVWGGVIKHLGAVENVQISGCDEIRYLWESEEQASKVLVNLRELDVSFCSNLVTLGEKENDKYGNNLTSLTRLVVQMCKSFEHCSCPKSIEYLRLFCCPSVAYVSFPTGGQKLKKFWIMNCEKLLENEFIGGGEKTRVLINSNMRMLEFLTVYIWPNLKSITELSSFNQLTELMIEGCPNLASFPDHELPKLTLLKHLTIVNCQSMDVSFPRGLWPPNLSSLKIGGLKKPISEWGPQNFPTSLVELELQGGRSEEVSSFNQLSHLFPSSLTSLHIEEFEKLESLAMGLQHLTALQHLHISDCPKLRDLPETLFALLLSLRIYHCPKLKELCSKRGSYWPLVTRIPAAL